MIRRLTRAWLWLPKETPLAFIHAPIKSGSLGILSLETTVPLLQKKRFGKLLAGQTPIDRALIELFLFKTVLRRVNLPHKVGKKIVCSTKGAKVEWTKLLRVSADGRALTTDDIDGASYHWVSKPSRVFPRLHLRVIQHRGRVLNTKVRASRGREKPPEEIMCRGACHTKETLNHVLQSCEITHNTRCARHNRFMKQVEKLLRRNAVQTWIEPIIPTDKSFIKHDLLIDPGQQVSILDISVVASPRMEQSHRLKVEKFDSQEIQTWIGTSTPIKHLPIIMSS